MTTLYDFEAQTIDGRNITLNDYADHVLLIVNTASRCGLTPQFAELEALYQTFQSQKFSILGFPCNQFRQQDPLSNQEIQQFCTENYGVSFPMFSKIEVNGPNAHPLFQYLKQQAPGILGTQSIKWNFTKFLINRDGKVIKRFAPNTKPLSLHAAITTLL